MRRHILSELQSATLTLPDSLITQTVNLTTPNESISRVIRRSNYGSMTIVGPNSAGRIYYGPFTPMPPSIILLKIDIRIRGFWDSALNFRSPKSRIKDRAQTACRTLCSKRKGGKIVNGATTATSFTIERFGICAQSSLPIESASNYMPQADAIVSHKWVHGTIYGDLYDKVVT